WTGTCKPTKWSTKNKNKFRLFLHGEFSTRWTIYSPLTMERRKKEFRTENENRSIGQFFHIREIIIDSDNDNQVNDS
ncbi:MAG: hypothetical protein ACKO96_38950, partial [Flammeovirgaceae bacterium]